jgi:hypothetical protein
MGQFFKKPKFDLEFDWNELKKKTDWNEFSHMLISQTNNTKPLTIQSN